MLDLGDVPLKKDKKQKQQLSPLDIILQLIHPDKDDSIFGHCFAAVTVEADHAAWCL